MSENFKFLRGTSFLTIFILVIILVILLSWMKIAETETSAPPVVIGNNMSKTELKDYLINYSVGTSGNLGSGLLNSSGYQKAGLGQPCINNNQNQDSAPVPNVPFAYTNQICDSGLGLVCVEGIFQGGGICLKGVNQICNATSDCYPGNVCINGICQELGGVIGQPCISSLQCRGPEGNENHVCDPYTRRCVYNIFPRDSGCARSETCLYYKVGGTLGDEVYCLSGVSSKPLYTFPATFIGVCQKPVGLTYSITGSGEDFFSMGLVPGNYLLVSSEETSLRVLLLEIYNKGTSVVMDIPVDTIEFQDKPPFVISLGEAAEGEPDGVCLIKYPIGTSPAAIGNNGNQVLAECETGTQLLNGYCVESGRTNPVGNLGEICVAGPVNQSGGVITCNGVCGLVCTYNDSLQNLLKSNYNYNRTTETINGVNPENTGYCSYQSIAKGLPCSQSPKKRQCLRPTVCLQSSEPSGGTFSYCNFKWDVMILSKLLGCPSNFKANSDGSKCLIPPPSKNSGVIPAVCQQGSDCLEGSKCFSGNQRIQYFSPTFSTYLKFNNWSGFPKLDNIIISKEFTFGVKKNPNLAGGWNYSDNTLSFQLFFFNQSDGSQLTSNPRLLNVNLNGIQEITSPSTSTTTQTLTSSLVEGSKPKVSVFQKENGDHQLNIFYLKKYRNWRSRLIQIQGSSNTDITLPLGSGLAQDAVFLFLDANKNIIPSDPYRYWTVDYSTVTGSGITITYPSGCFRPATSTASVTPGVWLSDARYLLTSNGDFRINFPVTAGIDNLFYSQYLTESISGAGINTGDKMTFTKGGTSFFISDTSGSDVELINGTSYFATPNYNPNLLESTILGDNYTFPPLINFTSSNYLNTQPTTVVGTPATTTGLCIYQTDTISGDRGFFTSEELYGVNMISILLNSGTVQTPGAVDSGYGFSNLGIQNPVPINIAPGFGTNGVSPIYFGFGDTNNVSYQSSPIGNLTDVSDFEKYSLEINEQVIMWGANINSTTDLCSKLEYTISWDGIANNSSQFDRYYPFPYNSKSIFPIISFRGVNTWSPPRPKVYTLANGYSDSSDQVFHRPYSMDRSILYNEEETTSVYSFTTYRDIPCIPDSSGGVCCSTVRLNSSKVQMANQEELVKINYNMPTTSKYPVMTYDVAIQNPSSNTTNFNFIDNISGNSSFGYPTPYSMSFPVVDFNNNQTDNYYIPGEFDLFLRVQEDIDVVLKYPSSEIVMSLFNYSSTGEVLDQMVFVFVGISNYEVNNNGVEILSIRVNNPFPPQISFENINSRGALLYLNNIFPLISNPVDLTSSGFTRFNPLDTSVIYTSTIDTDISGGDLGYGRTGYNKVISLTNLPGGTAFYKFYQMIGTTNTAAGNSYGNSVVETYNGFLTIFDETSGGVSVGGAEVSFTHFSPEGYFYIQPSSQNPPILLINDLYLSSISLTNNIVFSPTVIIPTSPTGFGGGFYYPRRNYLVGSDKVTGCTSLGVDTTPYYNGNYSGDQGALDSSYKLPVRWPSWINDLNTTSLKIYKLIIEFNPGNVENDIFLYCFAEVSGTNRLLYLPASFSQRTTIESQPVQMILTDSNGELTREEILQRSSLVKMFPINKKLFSLGGQCLVSTTS